MLAASEIQTWIAFIRTDGLALALIVFGAVIFVFVLRWLGTNTVKPLTTVAVDMGKAHIEFLNENIKGTQAITAGVGQVISTQAVYGEKIDDLHELLVIRRPGVSQQTVAPNAPTPPTGGTNV